MWIARLQGRHGFEKLVAIKTILPQFADDKEFRDLFLDEARITARIRHPNVASVLDLGEAESVLYLVFEWIDGDSLAVLQNHYKKRKERLPFEITLRVMADVCAGLHAAHELVDDEGKPLHVVHRDVSPQNVLVGVTGGAKVIDFGIAKALDRVTPETRSGILKGKLQYLSPEQAMGAPSDRRSDIWSAGVMLYELVAGKRPFVRDNPLQMLHMLASKPLRPTIPVGIPGSLVAILQHSLARDPAERFETAAAMQRALEIVMAQEVGPTTHDDVARFMRTQLEGRAEKRNRTIKLALEAASARERMHEALRASSKSLCENTPSEAPSPESSGWDRPESEAGDRSLAHVRLGLSRPHRPWTPTRRPSCPPEADAVLPTANRRWNVRAPVAAFVAILTALAAFGLYQLATRTLDPSVTPNPFEVSATSPKPSQGDPIDSRPFAARPPSAAPTVAAVSAEPADESDPHA